MLPPEPDVIAFDEDMRPIFQWANVPDANALDDLPRGGLAGIAIQQAALIRRRDGFVLKGEQAELSDEIVLPTDEPKRKEPARLKRVELIPPPEQLVEHMLEGQPDSAGARALRTASLLAEMQRHHWPGNVRELRNYVERCVALENPPPLGTSTAPAARVDATKPLRVAASPHSNWKRRSPRSRRPRMPRTEESRRSSPASTPRPSIS